MINSLEEFYSLLTNGTPSESCRVIQECAPLKVWLEVLHAYPDEKRIVIRNKHIPLEILSILSDDQDENIRWEVAAKRKLDINLFKKLANDPSVSVRKKIAINKKTPLGILENLTTDEDAEVRKTALDALAQGGTSPKRLNDSKHT